MPGLDRVVQTDFSLGAMQNIAPHLIPDGGLFSHRNGLHEADGSPFRRGGSVYKSNAAVANSVRWLWDGYLAAVGQRTVWSADSGGIYTLAADDVTPASVGGSGPTGPTTSAELNGILWFTAPTFVGAYGGSRKATYTTGTVTTVQGSTTVTGVGTLWTANVDAGMVFNVGGRLYVVGSVTDNTHLVLTEPYVAAGAGGLSYAAASMTAAATGTYTTANAAGTFLNGAAGVAVVGKRLWYWKNGVAAFSDWNNPHVFGSTNYHVVPGGANILGIWGIRNTALVFTTRGVYAIQNTELDLTDSAGNVQQRLDLLSSDSILLGPAGLAAWGQAVIAPCTDGIYAIDGVGAPLRLSDAFANLWRGYVGLGYEPGQSAVYRNHVFVPVLDSSQVVKDCIVVKLDAPPTRSGRSFPWSQMSGHGGNVTCCVLRQGVSQRATRLLAGSRAAGRILDLSGFFGQSAATKNDADGTAHVWELVTRDYPTGGLALNSVKKLRARYELVDAASDDPTITLDYALGPVREDTLTLWGSFTWGTGVWSASGDQAYFSAIGSAPEDPAGDSPYVWRLGERTRYIRYRLRSVGPSAKLALRSLETEVLTAGRY